MVSAWAQMEVASVNLGDERLDARLAILLSSLGDRPNLSIPAACGGHAERQEVIGAGELDGSRRGVLLHLMEAFTADGTPLGVLQTQSDSGVSDASDSR